MQHYEYKVVPAPDRAERIRGAKTPEDRFALTLEALMNQLGRDGWDYVRADTLPSSERSGLTRRATVYRSVLVFRRIRAEEAKPQAPEARLQTKAPAGKAPAIRAKKADDAPEEAAPATPALKAERAADES